MPKLVDCLAALVGGLSEGLVREAIIVDAGSTDQSAHLAADMGCKVITLPQHERGRGRQLQTGAQAASGDWLLFLHADTVLSDTWIAAIHRHMVHQPNKAAYFKLAFDQAGNGPNRVATLANWRARNLHLPYGDQGLLISRALYDAVGGYQALPLMEDVDIVRRLGAARLTVLEAIALTSGAKFQRGGWWAVPMRNLILVGAYFCGVSPDVLSRHYKS